MRKKINYSLSVALIVAGAFALGRASVAPYQVVVNGAPSKLQVIQDKDSILVPLSLPVSQELQQWNVSILGNEKSRQVEVKLEAVKKDLRGDTPCYWCKATGRCQLDYPEGSGINYSGLYESNCNGTGKCYHCSGTGKL